MKKSAHYKIKVIYLISKTKKSNKHAFYHTNDKIEIHLYKQFLSVAVSASFRQKIPQPNNRNQTSVEISEIH